MQTMLQVFENIRTIFITKAFQNNDSVPNMKTTSGLCIAMLVLKDLSICHSLQKHGIRISQCIIYMIYIHKHALSKLFIQTLYLKLNKYAFYSCYKSKLIVKISHTLFFLETFLCFIFMTNVEEFYIHIKILNVYLLCKKNKHKYLLSLSNQCPSLHPRM